MKALFIAAALSTVIVSGPSHAFDQPVTAESQHEAAIGYIAAASIARDVCPISKDQRSKLVAWINATIAENHLKPLREVGVWLDDHPTEKTFLFDAFDGDANARKIMCNILEVSLDISVPMALFPYDNGGYPKRRGVSCASGYKPGENNPNEWCEPEPLTQ